VLTSLKVKNYALISDVELNFNSGMNIITGETGAGKSILIGALGLALGKRADTAALRSKENKCVIEAQFDIDNYQLQSFFTDQDLDYEKHTILRREISTSGKSRAFINDTPVNLKELGELGNHLIEIHSQHDNLQLFKSHFQYYGLDALANSLEERNRYTELLSTYRQKTSLLEAKYEEEALLKKEADYNQFLFDELQAAELESSNEEELTNEQEMLENAEDLIRTFNEADQLFSGSEYSVNEQLNTIKHILSSQKTSLTDALSERIQSVIIELEDISSEISGAAENVEVNPERLELVNEKLAQLFNLKSKHRAESPAELIQLRNDLEEKLGATHNLENEILSLNSELLLLEEKLTHSGKALFKQRGEAIPEIEEQLNSLLAQVGMQHSRLKYTLERRESFETYGMDSLNIQLSSDKGASYNDIKKSASGGELARVNLCLKSLLAGSVSLPSSIFDEIDTGVSGEIARKVGSLMNAMSTSQQIIVITHLPQIASLGNNHLFVYKSEEGNTVETRVRTLENEQRITEIAKMISGDNLTEHAVEQSKALLGN
jgi:DNA repair protein RecN (Recombination protein N)